MAEYKDRTAGWMAGLDRDSERSPAEGPLNLEGSNALDSLPSYDMITPSPAPRSHEWHLVKAPEDEQPMASRSSASASQQQASSDDEDPPPYIRTRLRDIQYRPRSSADPPQWQASDLHYASAASDPYLLAQMALREGKASGLSLPAEIRYQPIRMHDTGAIVRSLPYRFYSIEEPGDPGFYGQRQGWKDAASVTSEQFEAHKASCEAEAGARYMVAYMARLYLLVDPDSELEAQVRKAMEKGEYKRVWQDLQHSLEERDRGTAAEHRKTKGELQQEALHLIREMRGHVMVKRWMSEPCGTSARGRNQAFVQAVELLADENGNLNRNFLRKGDDWLWPTAMPMNRNCRNCFSEDAG